MPQRSPARARPPDACMQRCMQRCGAVVPPKLHRLSPKCTACRQNAPPVVEIDRRNIAARTTAVVELLPSPSAVSIGSRSAVRVLRRNGLTRLLHRSFRRAWRKLEWALRLPVGDIGGRNDLVRLVRRIFDGELSLGHEPERCRVHATLAVRTAFRSQGRAGAGMFLEGPACRIDAAVSAEAMARTKAALSTHHYPRRLP